MFQVVVLLERRYAYLHKMESEICQNFGSKYFFTRESKVYLNDYPLFSHFTWAVYTIFFPLLLLVVIFSKIWAEHIYISHTGMFRFLVDSIFAFLTIISTSLYLLQIHFKK